mgnify:FL=1
MKAQVLQESFHKALRAVAWALPSKAMIRSTNVILLTVEQGRIQMEATDLETHATAYCPAIVEEEGIYLVQGRQLLETVALMTQERIQLASDGTKVTLKAGKSRASMATRDLEDFPTHSSLAQSSPARNIQAGALLDAIHAVSFAAVSGPHQVSMPMLQGVNLEIEPGVFRLTGCDSSRVAFSSVPSPGPLSKAITIPAGPFEAAVKMLSEEPKADVILVFDHSSVSLTVPNLASYRIQLLAATYPEVRRFIPANNPTIVTTNPKELADAIRFAQVFQGDSVIINLSIAAAGITVSASEEIGDAEHEVPATLLGQPLTLSLNSLFVLDWLEKQTGKVEISFLDDAHPVLFRAAGALPGDCYVCMPVYSKQPDPTVSKEAAGR